MSDIAIRVESLGKRYRIGEQQRQYSTLRESIAAQARRFTQRRHRAGEDAEDFWALKDVSFEVKQGEIVGVIGRNGAGKSTLLKILSRITEPTQGAVDLHGRVGSLLEVGTGFHPELTGRENIFLNGAILGMKRVEIRRKFDEIVDFAEIEKFLDTPVKHYSSGMYVRLAFAVAAHLEPEILLVDEVLAVGDVAFQKKCLGKIDTVATEGRTVLLVSHNIGAISQLSRTCIYFSQGRIMAVGTPGQVVEHYMKDTFNNEAAELDKLRPPGEWGTSIRFRQVRLACGRDAQMLFGEPLVFEMIADAYVSAESLSIGSSIYDSSGLCIGSLMSRETFSTREGQQLVLTLRVDKHNLAPGSYYAGFSIGRGGVTGQRHDLDVVIGAPAFQVLPIPQEGRVMGHWNPSWGRVVFSDTHLVVAESISDPAYI